MILLLEIIKEKLNDFCPVLYDDNCHFLQWRFVYYIIIFYIMRVGITPFEGTFFRKTNQTTFLFETLSSRFVLNLHLGMYYVHDLEIVVV